MSCASKLGAAIVMLGLVLGAVAVRAEGWKPAAGPLATRWTKDVSPSNAHPEYPRPQMVRPQWLNLNGLWQLAPARADDPIPVGRQLPEQVLVPFPIESALSGVMRHMDRVWYRRTFQVPEAWKGRRVLLHFQAVDWEATVYVNGREMGSHRGGYDAFSFDVTDALRPAGDQDILVKVFDPTNEGDQPRGKQVLKPGGIFYTPTTGIWQTAWLEAVPPARIDRLVLVPDVDAACLRLNVRGVGTGPQHRVVAAAREGGRNGGRDVAKASGRVGEVIRLSIPRSDLKLWSPDRPFLYDLAVTLEESGKAIDEVGSYFGMRKIDLGKDAAGQLRMRLNGQFVFQVGPLDQGFWPDGIYTAPTDAALRYDIEVTRQLGFNMTRKHVKIEPDRWYYWCDRLGLLVWQDMPSGWRGRQQQRTAEAKGQFERELLRMVEGLANHPSIIMWVVFNEGWGQHDTPHYVELVKKLDPSRLVNNASGWTDQKVGDVIDVHSYPGPAAPKPERARAGVLGEFGGLKLAVPKHTWTEKTWGYRETQDPAELTQKYESLLRGVWRLRQSQGLSAAVYTQITDVETECNGLLTYDRAVIKPDAKRVAAANAGRFPQLKTLVPTSQGQAVLWRYAFQRPGEGWFRPGFDAAAWNEGPGGFGTKGTPGSVVRTEWKTPEIWARREFSLPVVGAARLLLVVHHDEDVAIYINGVLAAQAPGYTTDYEDMPISPAARAALRPGKNLLAVHCKQTAGGQYVDVGIARVEGE